MKFFNVSPKNEIAIILTIIKMFLIIPCGVILSTLVLYLTHDLKWQPIQSAYLMATVISCSGLVRLFTGYVGKRFLSFQFLLFFSALFLFLGFFLLAYKSIFLFAITLITCGIGLTISVNCLLTDLFPSCTKRETAFLWNYTGINISYCFSFLISGYFELTREYLALFMITSCFPLIAIILIVFNYKKIIFNLAGHQPSQRISSKVKILGAFLVFVFFYFVIKHSLISNILILMMSFLLFMFVLYYAFRQSYKVKKKLFLYLIFIILGLIFFTISNLSPILFTLLIDKNIDRHFWGMFFSPQWLQSINGFCIIIFCPCLIWLTRLLRRRGLVVSSATQFSMSLILMGSSLLILKYGISITKPNELMSPHWMMLCLILQSIAESLMVPIGFAMIGSFVPEKLQGLLIGGWMLLISVGAILAGYFSNLNDYNTHYHFTVMYFNQLGLLASCIGIISLIFLPKLSKNLD